MRIIYAHGNGFVKDKFYNSMLSLGLPSIFSTQDRAEHARKRKLVSHAFSPGAIHDFEPYMSTNLELWVSQLDRIAAKPGQDGFTRVNIMPWCTYLAFDIIGDLAFGAPFGMIKRGSDECESVRPGKPTVYVPGARTLNQRGRVSAVLGFLPALSPWAQYIPHPFYYGGIQSIKDLEGMAIAAITKRLKSMEGDEWAANKRQDILEMLCRGTDADGRPMPRDELIAEAHTQIIAGSDTVSNTACAIIYWILDGERRNPGKIIPRLQAELDESIRTHESIATHSEVKDLPFLRQCVDEAMRINSTHAIGLPRLVTGEGGVVCENEHFPASTVLSVPTYTLHHDAEIWGPDVEEFNPDRWLNTTPEQKLAFNPFSRGPRACVGQNVGQMELSLIIGTAFHRYDFKLYQRELECKEGFSKKPVECWVGIKPRSAKV